jgi:hypothetical protein
MRFSVPTRSRNHVETYSRWINAVGLVCVLGAIFWGARLRFHFPSTPLSDPDTWGYLNPALSWLGGQGFQQTAGRGWLYPAILAAILKIGGDFSWITYAQHIQGLLAAWVIWQTYRLWQALLGERGVLSQVAELLIGLPVIFLYVLGSGEIVLEALIRPEGIVAIFGASYLFCLVGYFSARWHHPSARRSIVFGAVLLGLSYVIFLLKPSWGISLLFTLLPLLAGTMGDGSFTTRFVPLLAGLGLFALLAVMPFLLGFQRDSSSRTFLPTTLVSVHAKQIALSDRKMIEGDLHRQNSNDPGGLFYRSLERVLLEAKKQPGGCKLLGFDPDYILYRSGLFQDLTLSQHWNAGQLASFCYAVYLKAWLDSPLEMSNKVCQQFSLFFFPDSSDFYSSVKGFRPSREFLYSRQVLPSANPEFNASVRDPYSSYLERLRHPLKNIRDSGGRRFFQFLARNISKLSVWVQLGFLCALVATFIDKTLSRLRLAGFAALAAAAAVYGNVLTVAVVHTLDIGRYRVTYSPYYLLMLAMMATFLIVVASGLLLRGFVRRPDRNPDEYASPPSKSARV